MSATNSTIVLPNPYTPMAWLTPDVASKVTNQVYVAVGSVAVLMWDIALHTPQDYKLLTRYGMSFPSIVYCIARLSSLAYLLGLVIVTTAPVNNCDYIRRISFVYPLAISSSVLLLAFRVRGLYHNNKYVVAFLSLSWLSVLATAIAMLIGLKGVQIGKTQYCMEVQSKTSEVLTAIGPFVNNSLVFMATSWVFLRSSNVGLGISSGSGTLQSGKRFYTSSKCILREGQAYHLATLIFNFGFIVTCFIPNPLIYPSTLSFPNFVLITNLSCYIYRKTRLGFYQGFSRGPSVDKGLADSNTSSGRRQQQRLGIEFKSATTRSVHFSEGVDLEAARAEHLDDSHEKVNQLDAEDLEGSSIGEQRDKPVVLT